jgi:tetratricopeptide (TPR) repeat protein
MKKHYLFGILAGGLLAQPAVAQHSKVITAWGYLNSKEFDKARDAINLATQNDQTKTEAKTWFYRGEAYQGLYATNEQKLREADKADPTHKAYGTYIADNTDLKEAAISYRKAIELDKSNDFPEAKDNLVVVSLLGFNDALGMYNFKNYKAALDKFEQFQASYDALGASRKKIDDAFAHTKPPTDIREVKLYMAGCAIKLDDRAKAKKLFEELVDSKYANQAIYINLSNYSLNDKDTAKAIAVLDKGISVLPDTLKTGVLIEKLRIFVRQGKTKEAIKVAEDAIAHDTKGNISLYNALGKMYSEQKMYDKAVETYNKGLKIKSDDFGISSGLGIVKFNQGVDKYNESINAKANSDQDKYFSQAKAIWKDAIVTLENALKLPGAGKDREDLRATYEALSQMYFKLNDPANGQKYRDLNK